MVAMLCVYSAGARADTVPIPIQDFAPVNVGAAVARENTRTISQLPPVTNLAFAYRFDPTVNTYVGERDDLGSGMVVSPRFNRAGGLALMYSFAYYRLDEFNGDNSAAVIVNVPTDRFNPNSPRVNLGVGTQAAADVTVSRFAGRYTILDRWDAGIAVPLVSVDMKSTYAVQVLNGQAEIDNFAANGVHTADVGNTLLNTPLNRLAIPGGFSEGNNVDVGNIELDSKYGFDSDIENLDLGVQGTLRLPCTSDAEDHFAGRNSTSVKGLLLADYRVRRFGFYFNGGYEYDFNDEFMSNAVLAVSATVKPHPRWILEVGMRANFYDKNVDLFDSQQFSQVLPGTQVVVNNAVLGKDEINIGGGVRVNPYGDLSVSFYISAPATNDGFRADGIFSLSLDYPI